MLISTKEHIIYLYVWLDDKLPTKTKKAGRPSRLSHSELITILIWNTLTVKQKNLKDIYQWIEREYKKEFPLLPCYENFVKHCHRSLPLLMGVLETMLDKKSPVKIMDSTMLEVCRLIRADKHKTCKNIAKFGKNHQGWHYGFKLHLSINSKGQFSGIAFTPANFHDAQVMPMILNKYTKVAVGDGGYTARVMREYLWKKYGTIIISPPHPKQKKKVIADWQLRLLKARPKIESVYDYLKEHLHLVSSFPRSVKGYLFHYFRILIGYQFMALTK